MANVIFAERTINGFEYSDSVGAFSPGEVFPAEYVLVVGESYKVVWDGEEFNCVAFSWVFDGLNMVAIGNGTSLGLSGNGEPFFLNYCAAVVGGVAENSQMFCDSEGTHTVAIYAADDATDSSVGVVLSECTLDFTDSGEGYYRTQHDLTGFLIPGELYRVMWDGVEHILEASGSDILSGYIGNAGILDGSTSGEPFLISTNLNLDCFVIKTNDTSSTHTVSIYVAYEGSEDGETVILEEKEFTFQDAGIEGVYIGLTSVNFKPFVVGDRWKVIWDGEAWTCEVFELDGMIVFGNAGMVGGTVTEEPFLVIPEYIGTDSIGFMTTDTSPSHTVAIYATTDSDDTTGTDNEQEKPSSNVLATLFRDIADSIRKKTGYTETMKPSEFPSKIALINAASPISGLKYVADVIKVDGVVATINHNMGHVPDIIIMYNGGIPENNSVILSIAYSSAMLESIGGGYKSRVNFALAGVGSTTVSSNVGMEMEINQDSLMYEQCGGIRSVTDTSFMVGSDSYVLNGTYNWIAIGGITG